MYRNRAKLVDNGVVRSLADCCFPGTADSLLMFLLFKAGIHPISTIYASYKPNLCQNVVHADAFVDGKAWADVSSDHTSQCRLCHQFFRAQNMCDPFGDKELRGCCQNCKMVPARLRCRSGLTTSATVKELRKIAAAIDMWCIQNLYPHPPSRAVSVTQTVDAIDQLSSAEGIEAVQATRLLPQHVRLKRSTRRGAGVPHGVLYDPCHYDRSRRCYVSFSRKLLSTVRIFPTSRRLQLLLLALFAGTLWSWHTHPIS